MQLQVHRRLNQQRLPVPPLPHRCPPSQQQQVLQQPGLARPSPRTISTKLHFAATAAAAAANETAAAAAGAAGANMGVRLLQPEQTSKTLSTHEASKSLLPWRRSKGRDLIFLHEARPAWSVGL